jgi:hypothetical protein
MMRIARASRVGRVSGEGPRLRRTFSGAWGRKARVIRAARASATSPCGAGAENNAQIKV